MKQIQTEGDLLSGGDASGPETHNVRINGRRITTLGTLSTGQNGFNPSPAIAGSTFVTINGIPIVLVGGLYAPHSNGVVVQQESALGSGFPVTATN
jgi:uncharacterized Zn-binding protein involved in type VI secretion